MKNIMLCLAASLALSACGDTTAKEVLGIDSRAPDEFRVVSRPPLSVPPQFDLRPPSIEGVGQPAQRDKAQSLVLGEDTGGKAKASTSTADNIFLQKAGAAAADPNVKQELTEKRINEQLEKEDESWWSKISGSGESKEPVVKAEGEADRIRKNKEAGKPVTEGETPESGGGTMSTLERWFGSW